MGDAAQTAIQVMLQTYFDGLYHSDVARLRGVFHPQAVYACATAEPAVILRMDEYFPIVEKRVSPASRGDPRSDRILSIEMAGPVTAHARVECALLPKQFTDLLTLIHVDGRWQVIAKVFHYELQA
ncbi:MAG TPA: nuclear transport factor 2 family protein [Ideonella sp.]|uniref:nuclear transport factor 2 family protein n=1 Tax=Ideonella sp. TaxID=1929293 RepID=UPI002E2F4D0F|nr:nuclear transport factor 2 family protein [Ideonella sp.]HEX5685854.1 nuclear transport factor 2 family protein [Ideonella sp.]